MKGIVFTEFLEMVEETFSVEVVDQIIGGFSTVVAWCVYCGREL